MQGTVRLNINQETLNRIVQEWATKEFRTGVKVTDVITVSTGRLSDAATFEIVMSAESWREDRGDSGGFPEPVAEKK